MLTASTKEDKAISGEETSPLTRRMCSACCSVEEGDNSEEGKLLNFIQHDAGLLSLLYSTYSTQRAQSPSDDLRKGAIADCFEC